MSKKTSYEDLPVSGPLDLDVLYKYVEGKLPAKKKESVEMEIAAHPFYRDILEELKKSDKAQVDASVNSINQKIDNLIPQKKKGGEIISLNYRKLYIAAVVVGIISTFIWLILPSSEPVKLSDMYESLKEPSLRKNEGGKQTEKAENKLQEPAIEDSLEKEETSKDENNEKPEEKKENKKEPLLLTENKSEKKAKVVSNNTQVNAKNATAGIEKPKKMSEPTVTPKVSQKDDNGNAFSDRVEDQSGRQEVAEDSESNQDKAETLQSEPIQSSSAGTSAFKLDSRKAKRARKEPSNPPAMAKTAAPNNPIEQGPEFSIVTKEIIINTDNGPSEIMAREEESKTKQQAGTTDNPEYEDGDQEIIRFLKEKTNLSHIEKCNCKIAFSFIVTPEGKVSAINFKSGKQESINNAVADALKSMPGFNKSDTKTKYYMSLKY